MTEQLTAAQLEAWIYELFPALEQRIFAVEAVEPDGVRLRMRYHAMHLRPGGTISGPALMTLTDTAAYMAILAQQPAAIQAVTTNLTITFLRRPAPGDILAHAHVLKLGRTLAVVTVTMYSAGNAAPVAHATTTYALPRTPTSVSTE